MIDYSEGYLELKQHLNDLWKATLTHDWPKAMRCCLSIQATATQTAILIHQQAEKEKR